MICFPLDNTPYEAKDMGTYLATRTRGVFSSDGNLAVTPGESGLSVSVSPGLAWLKWSDYWGTAALQEQALTLALDTADGALKRIDAIVCRLDKVNNLAEIVVKKGPFSSSPVLLPPVRDTNYDELYIATILIDAGIVNISADAITDQRLNEEYCGLMRDGVTGIPTALLQEQVQQLIDHLREEINGVEQGSEVMLKTIYDPQGRNTDIFAAIPNPNLLDNSDFTNPVNQRGDSVFDTNGYCIDRWQVFESTYDTTTRTVTADDVAGTYGSQFRQIIDLNLLSENDTVSVSAYVNNTIYKFTKTISPYTGSILDAPYDLETSWGGFKIILLAHRPEVFFVMFLKPSQKITVNWAKLERGTSVTPYIPKGYGVEMAECLRYYYQVSSVRTFGQQHTGAGTYVNVILPQVMRVTPTVSAPGEWTIRFNGMDKKATVSSVGSLNGNTLNLTMSTIAGGTYIGPLYAFYNDKITFSADL